MTIESEADMKGLLRIGRVVGRALKLMQAAVLSAAPATRTALIQPEIIATAMKLAKTIGKIGVLVGLIAGTAQLLMNDRPTERVLAAEAAAD